MPRRKDTIPKVPLLPIDAYNPEDLFVVVNQITNEEARVSIEDYLVSSVLLEDIKSMQKEIKRLSNQLQQITTQLDAYKFNKCIGHEEINNIPEGHFGVNSNGIYTNTKGKLIKLTK